MAKISLGRYMWERIHQVGVDTIFGVPGDFNLQFLDAIFQVEGLRWVGNQNELNAAYAADGYARVKGVPGAFVTTHGVGELSALNGVGGAISERVKMIHVVGQTPRAMQENHLMVHHSIGNKPDHQQFNQASRGLRFAAAELWDVKTAPAEIDRVIRECFIQSGPVYIFLPLDLSAEEVPADLLNTPIDTSPKIDTDAQEKAISAIIDALSASKHPSILVDVLTRQFNAAPEARALVSRLNVPFFSTSMGKGMVDETHEMYVGVWSGEISAPGVAAVGKASDLVVTLGCFPTYLNTGGFTRELDETRTIHINPFDVVVKGYTYKNTSIKALLSALVESLPSAPVHNISPPSLPPSRTPLDKDAKHITQSYLWPAMEQFLKPDDVLLGEAGTTIFGLFDIKFPPRTRFITQINWASIGYATPATLGADIAKTEIGKQGRTILITGDGSLAMTLQEVGTMVKEGIKPILFVINNDGYTVERMIRGAQMPYNDIAPTAYSHLLPLFKHPSPSTSFHLATTKSELDSVLSSPELQNPSTLQLVEVVVPKNDSPWRFQGLLANRGEAMKDYLTKEGFVNTYGDWGLGDMSNGDVKWS